MLLRDWGGNSGGGRSHDAVRSPVNFLLTRKNTGNFAQNCLGQNPPRIQFIAQSLLHVGTHLLSKAFKMYRETTGMLTYYLSS